MRHRLNVISLTRAAVILCMALLLSVTGCAKENPRVVTTFNEAASLPADLPYNPLQWRVITSAIDRQDSTMYTLFGNDQAIGYATRNAQHDYPAGSILALVTWKQQEDPRWFGSNIPSTPKSIEFVTVSVTEDHRTIYLYQEFSGHALNKAAENTNSTLVGRAAYLISQRAAVMP